MKRLSLRLLGACLLLSCAIPPLPAGATGGQFGFEFAIDAPWRLEPVRASDGSLSYGPIPIVVTFHDAVFEVARGRLAGLALERIPVGRLRQIRVREYTKDQPIPRHPVTLIGPSSLREIERRPLVSMKTREPNAIVCRPAPGRDCAALLDISRSHDWQAVFWYTPKDPVVPGRNIHLEVTAVTDHLDTILVDETFRREWTNYLVVHAGEAPLPRFGDDWLYGDLHYHGQMTDNEGESAYTYRNTARALGAMGMDFAFATDHASNSVQVDGSIDGEFCAEPNVDSCIEARDLNRERFARAKTVLYGTGGVNGTIALEAEVRGLPRLRAANVLPQVYMGEEVDAWPEISRSEFAAGALSYGDGLKYKWPNSNACLTSKPLSTCQSLYSVPYRPNDRRSFLLRDEQGIPFEEEVSAILPDGTQPAPSRQHIVYFPEDASNDSRGWVASDTGRFGGAGKRLEHVIGEIEAGGAAFLAHPVTGSGPGGPGPDMVPYSDAALLRAWRSQAILGLQVWNENDRHSSAPNQLSPTVMFVSEVDGNSNVTSFRYPWPFQGHRSGNFPWDWQRGGGAGRLNDLYHGAFAWDRFLRRGLDPQATAELAWLERGQPRKWFMAGGSDAHGDFNYRRYGRPCRDRWCDVPVGDTAMGNPRNLVSMALPPQTGPVLTDNLGPAPSAAGPMRYSNRQVIAALRSGQFSVTDGPALRIAVDRNRNGIIDRSDLPMGSTFDFFPGEHIPLLVEWRSTAEFGPVTEIDLYVGNRAVTFAPRDVRPPNGAGAGYAPDPSAALRISLADSFGRVLPGLPAGIGHGGVARLFLGPAAFGLANADGALSYVRATAKTIAAHQGTDLGLCPAGGIAGNKCGSRLAYSNPVWSRFRPVCPPRPSHHPIGTAFDTPAVFGDADGNAFPDSCEGQVPNPCAPPPEPGGIHGALDTLPTVAVDPDAPPALRIPATSCQRIGS